MSAFAPTAFPARPDLRLWLAALTERGGVVCSMSAGSDSESAGSAGEGAVDLDAQDVPRARRGDDQAFEHIVRRYQHDVSLRLRKFSRDPLVHEELVQETFVQAFLGLRGYRGDAPLIHWLHRIAVRVGYRFWREQRSRPVHATLDAHTLPAPTPRERVQLDHVLERLSPRDRLVLTLMHLEDRSVEETAALTGWSQPMVKVQAYRARRRLRTLMEDMSQGEQP
jgi:RNA polymerase sigma-70 factor, ECF subfamily